MVMRDRGSPPGERARRPRKVLERGILEDLYVTQRLTAGAVAEKIGCSCYPLVAQDTAMGRRPANASGTGNIEAAGIDRRGPATPAEVSHLLLFHVQTPWHSSVRQNARREERPAYSCGIVSSDRRLNSGNVVLKVSGIKTVDSPVVMCHF